MRYVYLFFYFANYVTVFLVKNNKNNEFEVFGNPQVEAPEYYFNKKKLLILMDILVFIKV